MTKQQIFDTAVNHLHAQRIPAFVSQEGCRYRTPDGLKCAIGALIPDSAYVPQIEKSPVHECYIPSESGRLSPTELMVRLGYEEHLPFLRELQSVHDDAAQVAYGDKSIDYLDVVQAQLWYVRDKYNLEATELLNKDWT